jgi:hypothetical protein
MSIEQFLEAMEIERNEQRYRKYKKELDEMLFEERFFNYFEIERVIFNPPATIVIWKDGTKTVVKCNGEKFDQEKGLAMAISKRALAVGNRYHKTFKKFVSDDIPYLEEGVTLTCYSPNNEYRTGDIVRIIANQDDLFNYHIPREYSGYYGKVERLDQENHGEDILVRIGGDSLYEYTFWFKPTMIEKVNKRVKTK